MTPPEFPVPLTQLEAKALWVHGFATMEQKVDGVEGLMEDALCTGLQKLQQAAQRYFTPGVTDGTH